jgi:hypothetical protein
VTSEGRRAVEKRGVAERRREVLELRGGKERRATDVETKRVKEEKEEVFSPVEQCVRCIP